MSEPCGHCGRPGVGTYERGWGADANGTLLCHPNDDGPDCYTLVTRDRHATPCPECQDDATYARAQERGEALAREMHANGTLRARSPRREVRLGDG